MYRIWDVIDMYVISVGPMSLCNITGIDGICTGSGMSEMSVLSLLVICLCLI